MATSTILTYKLKGNSETRTKAKNELFLKKTAFP